MSPKAIVIGAGGALGEATALALRRCGWRVVGTFRRDRPDPAARLRSAGVEIAAFDLCAPLPLDDLATGADALVFTPNLALVASALGAFRSVMPRIVAVSSNNVAVDPNAPSYRILANAEAEILARQPEALVLRPTLIFGDPRLPTVPSLMRLARRTPILPVPGSGRALVQPLFHGDLAALIAGLLEQGAPGGRYAAGGPDVVAMRAFFRAAAKAANARALVLPAPLWSLNLARRVGLRLPLDAAQLARTENDRRAIPETPLPTGLAPRTTLREGLEDLATALGYR